MYFSDFVTRDWSEGRGYEHFHVIPTGWFEFLPQGSAGSVQIDRADGNPTRRCFAKMMHAEDDDGSWSGWVLANATADAMSPVPEPDPTAMVSEDPNGDAAPTFGAPVDPNYEAACANMTNLPLINLAVGGKASVAPAGDIKATKTLIDGDLDRNWHSIDTLARFDTQTTEIQLPGVDWSGQDLNCIGGIKLFWRNVYTAAAVSVHSSLDGKAWTGDLVPGLHGDGGGKNLPAEVGRVDDLEFGLHDARFVKLVLLAKQVTASFNHLILFSHFAFFYSLFIFAHC